MKLWLSHLRKRRKRYVLSWKVCQSYIFFKENMVLSHGDLLMLSDHLPDCSHNKWIYATLSSQTTEWFCLLFSRWKQHEPSLRSRLSHPSEFQCELILKQCLLLSGNLRIRHKARFTDSPFVFLLVTVFRELTLQKGDIVYIHRQVDANWFEGEHHGRAGIFPTTYVEVIFIIRSYLSSVLCCAVVAPFLIP